jgi:hypothetical protein
MLKESSLDNSNVNVIIFGDKSIDLKLLGKKLIKKDFLTPTTIKLIKFYQQTNHFLGEQKYEKININIFEDYDWGLEGEYIISKYKINYLKPLNFIKSFILVVNGHENDPKIDSLNIQFLKLLDFAWGNNFWDNLIIVIDNWDSSPEEILKRKTINKYENLISEEINNYLKKIFYTFVGNGKIVFLNTSTNDENQEEELKIKLIYLRFNWLEMSSISTNKDSFSQKDKDVKLNGEQRLKSGPNKIEDFDGKIVKFVSVQSGKFLEIENNSMDPLSKLIQNDESSNLNQRFILKRTNQYFSILALHSFLALDVHPHSNKTGAKILQWTFNRVDNQLFKILECGDDCYNIMSKNSGLNWEISDKSLSQCNYIFQSERNNGPYQKFRIIFT